MWSVRSTSVTLHFCVKMNSLHMNKIIYSRLVILSWLVAFSISALHAQDIFTNGTYDSLKESGQLPAGLVGGMPQAKGAPVYYSGEEKSGGGSACDCWIAPDASYQLAMAPNDDDSSPLLTLPFAFDLYSDLYTDLFINNNGNVSFVSAFATFTAAGFPNADFIMIAPFWGDVDTRGVGQVWYRMTPTALYVNWVDVGYFNSHTDKVNNFQLIITDGTDPVIGIGNNVSFCYQDMQWTTGDASAGVNGFGGSPAIVGANRGNGVEFIQFGAFDQAGGAYDGPFANNDGIDWLDSKNFEFSVATTSSNVAPIPSSAFLCDTLTVCTGSFVQLQMDMLAPEQNQTTTATSSSTLSNYVEATNTVGITATIIGEFTPTLADVGFHTINYSGTDNGTPALTTVVDIVVEVVQAPSAPPTITGDSVICQGEVTMLNASAGFTIYDWSTGATGQSISTGGGTFTVSTSLAGCLLTSPPFTVTEVPLPTPMIIGTGVTCNNEPTTLSLGSSYASYGWSTGSVDSTVSVGAGNYSVTVTNAQGCAGTANIQVSAAAAPTAFFTGNPIGTVTTGYVLDVLDGSSVTGGTIASWTWDFGNGNVLTGSNPGSVVYNVPGIYQVQLTITTNDGCTDSFSVSIIVGILEPVVPNVFTPNADGENDAFFIQGLEFARNARLEIFNRWGNVVFESANYRNNWRANDVPDGTYYYILVLSDGRDFSGHVTILR